MQSQPPPIRERTFNFAVRIIRMVRAFPNDVASREIGRQVVRSGTSIGANIEEAQGDTTDAEFTHKLSLARRESHETNYWLRLVREAEMLPRRKLESLIGESEEIVRILVASTRRRRAMPAATRGPKPSVRLPIP